MAAVLAYLFTLVLTDGAVDLTGALTALLVVQASAVSTLKMGVVRVGAVLSGVLIAILLSTWIGLTWWSLGLAVRRRLLISPTSCGSVTRRSRRRSAPCSSWA